MNNIINNLIKILKNSNSLLLIIISILLFIGFLILSFKIKFRHLYFLKNIFKESFYRKKIKHQHGLNSLTIFLTSFIFKNVIFLLIGSVSFIKYGKLDIIFWYFISLFFYTSLDFCNAILAQVFKKKDEDDEFIGGPNIYIKELLNIKEDKDKKNFIKKIILYIFIGLNIILVTLYFPVIQIENIALFNQSENLGLNLSKIIFLIVIFNLVISNKKLRVTFLNIFTFTILIIFIMYSYLMMDMFFDKIDNLPDFILEILNDILNLDSFFKGFSFASIFLIFQDFLFKSSINSSFGNNILVNTYLLHPIKQAIFNVVGNIVIFIFNFCTAFNLYYSNLYIQDDHKFLNLEAILNLNYGIWANYISNTTLFLLSVIINIALYYHMKSYFKQKKTFYIYLHSLLAITVIEYFIIRFTGFVQILGISFFIGQILSILILMINLIIVIRNSNIINKVCNNYEKHTNSEKNAILDTLDLDNEKDFYLFSDELKEELKNNHLR